MAVDYSVIQLRRKLFCLSSAGGHLCYFQFLAITKGSAVNILVHLSFHSFAGVAKRASVAELKSQIICTFRFVLDIVKFSCKNAEILHTPTNSV